MFLYEFTSFLCVLHIFPFVIISYVRASPGGDSIYLHCLVFYWHIVGIRVRFGAPLTGLNSPVVILPLTVPRRCPTLYRFIVVLSLFVYCYFQEQCPSVRRFCCFLSGRVSGVFCCVFCLFVDTVLALYSICIVVHILFNVLFNTDIFPCLYFFL